MDNCLNYFFLVQYITNIYPAITTASGRVYQLRVIGSSGTSAVQAGAIREVLVLLYNLHILDLM